MSGLFHSTQFSPDPVEAPGEVREFAGDGTHVLSVPKLTKVLSVHVGRTKVPLDRDYKYPLNSDATRQEKVRTTLPHVVLRQNEEGQPVLLRSIHSNDGIWQLEAKIYVGGDWEDGTNVESTVIVPSNEPSTPTAPNGPPVAPAADNPPAGNGAKK